MAGNANGGGDFKSPEGKRKLRAAKRYQQTLGELSDAVVRKFISDETKPLKERAELAIRITVKRMPTVIDSGGSFNEFMANLLTKGDKLGSK